MATKRETKTRQKHADIYKEYQRLLSEEYKGIAQYLNRKFMYDQIAEKLRCSSEHVRKVINKMNQSQEA